MLINSGCRTMASDGLVTEDQQQQTGDSQQRIEDPQQQIHYQLQQDIHDLLQEIQNLQAYFYHDEEGTGIDDHHVGEFIKLLIDRLDISSESEEPVEETFDLIMSPFGRRASS